MNQIWQRVGVAEKICRSAPMRPMSVKTLLQTNSYETSALIKTAEWVREELTVRLAYRLCDFHRLPYVVLCNPFIDQSYRIHVTTFETLMRVSPIRVPEEQQSFVSTLREEKAAHDTTVDLMGQGVSQLRFVCSDISLDKFMERFFFFRIGRRTMIDHLIALERPQEGWSGCINLHCRPAEIIQNVISTVRQSCCSSYGLAPRVVLGGNLNTEFPFIPDHLAIIMTEVLKNALRATVEFHTFGNSVTDEGGAVIDEHDVPEVMIEVYKGRQEVVIKVSDKGGGFPPTRLKDIMSFGYSTVSESLEKLVSKNVSSWIRPEMAGYGFGLPLSRVFARYFGGDIHLQPCFGVGTDVFITLNHMGENNEPIFCYKDYQYPQLDLKSKEEQEVLRV